MIPRIATSNYESRPAGIIGGVVGGVIVVFAVAWMLFSNGVRPPEPRAAGTAAQTQPPVERTSTAAPEPTVPTSVDVIDSEDISDDWSDELGTDTSGNVYRRQIFYCHGDKGSISLALNGMFSRMSGTIYVPEVARGIDQDELGLPPRVEIFGDDILLYSLVGLLDRDPPRDFEIDVSGFDAVTITMEGRFQGEYSSRYPLNCLSNLNCK